jgi:opacity protein-like surface antigen
MVQPYINFGIGASVNTMGQLTGHLGDMPTGVGPGDTKVNFAWQAGGGLKFDTGIPGLSVAAGYSYLHLGNFSTTSTFNLFSGVSITRPPFNVNVAEHVLTTTLVYHFAAPPPPP